MILKHSDDHDQEIHKCIHQPTIGEKVIKLHHYATEKSVCLEPLQPAWGRLSLFVPSQLLVLMGKGISSWQKVWFNICKLSTFAAGISLPQTAENSKL